MDRRKQDTGNGTGESPAGTGQGRRVGDPPHRSKFALLLKAIRFEHTAFALPFALTAAVVAAAGWPRAWSLGWILVAMVGARTAAMAGNRLADEDYDRRNPRTATRALVTGALTRRHLWIALLASAAAYFLAAGMLNWLCLALSPFALAVLLGYSFTKRFTVATHWILGFALGLAPAGAWLAIRGRIELAPLLLTAAVTTWTAGFDIIYACQDIAFDRQHGLFSLPARWGARRALVIAALNHAFTVWFLVLFGHYAHLGWLYLLGVVLLIPVLWYEHHVVRPDDLSRAELASFVANGLFSIVLFLFAAADVIVLRSLGPF
jgi:4-hydroxybenzoate polyprenyltransferase